MLIPILIFKFLLEYVLGGSLVLEQKCQKCSTIRCLYDRIEYSFLCKAYSLHQYIKWRRWLVFGCAPHVKHLIDIDRVWVRDTLPNPKSVLHITHVVLKLYQQNISFGSLVYHSNVYTFCRSTYFRSEPSSGFLHIVLLGILSNTWHAIKTN